METTTNMRKAEVLAIIKDNRDKHRSVFEAALDGYRTRARSILKEWDESLSSGRVRELRIVLDMPKDHTRDYDRIIKMLEMDTGDEVEMDENMFAQYVMDDWSWKRTWLSMSSRYAAAATSQAYGDISDE